MTGANIKFCIEMVPRRARHVYIRGRVIEEVLAMSAVTNEIPTTERMVLAPARYVLLPVAHLLTGYTVKAMERKIERGDWQEGKVWRHAPDGHIMIDMQGYHRWVESR